MNILKRAWVFIKANLMGNVDKVFYKDNKRVLEATNYSLLTKTCLFSVGMCFFLFILTFFNETIKNLKIFYLIFTIFFALETLAVLTVVKKHKKLSKLFYYIYAVAILFLAAYVGTFVTPDSFAVTYYVFLIIVPMLHVCRPIYATILSICACVAFCILTFFVKSGTPEVMANDILNAVCCCIVGACFNITIINLQLEAIQTKVHLEYISSVDELTSLYNRRSLNLYINDVFAAKHDNIIIMMIDVDNFKHYNDYYGHLEGDECLRKIGGALQSIAAKNSLFIARFGGEEFVAISTSNDLNYIGSVCDNILKEVEALAIKNAEENTGNVSISIGYSDSKSTQAQTYMQLLNYADTALYISKINGKNRATRYENN